MALISLYHLPLLPAHFRHAVAG